MLKVPYGYTLNLGLTEEVLMGIDYDGGMIVGLQVYKIDGFYDLVEDWLNEDHEDPHERDETAFLEHHDLEKMCPYFDAELEHSVIGFRVADIDLNPNEPSVMMDFTKDINNLAEKFKFIFGVYPKLIGCQDIY